MCGHTLLKYDVDNSKIEFYGNLNSSLLAHLCSSILKVFIYFYVDVYTVTVIRYLSNMHACILFACYTRSICMTCCVLGFFFTNFICISPIGQHFKLFPNKKDSINLFIFE